MCFFNNNGCDKNYNTNLPSLILSYMGSCFGLLFFVWPVRLVKMHATHANWHSIRCAKMIAVLCSMSEVLMQ